MHQKYEYTSNNLFNSLNELKYALLNNMSFDFVSHSANSHVLFLGEGNFSFSLSIANAIKNIRKNFITTSFDNCKIWSNEALKNISILNSLGAMVFHSIDATKIGQIFEGTKFDLIVFQFPNVGSRKPIYGKNPNHTLIRSFLKNSQKIISKNGVICITTINSPYYDGAFSMDKSAKWAGFDKPDTYPFFIENFPQYTHVNTLDENESALTKDDNFITFVFQQNENRE